MSRSLPFARALAPLALAALSACSDGSVLAGADARSDVGRDASVDASFTDSARADAPPSADASALDAPVADAPAAEVAAPDAPSTDGPSSGCGSVPSSWVCTATGRQRCVSGMVQSEVCSNGCTPGSGTADATCTAASSGCAGSASGTTDIWTCTADRTARQRCVSNAIQTERCAHGCTAEPSGTDDVCTPDCSASASGTSGVWTCTADGTARQRCVSGATQTELCPTGCVRMATGVDDVCGAGCSSSASGTSGIWTCTADRTSRQRCVSGAVQTERCANGCVVQPVGTNDYCQTAAGCAGSASGTSGIWTCTTDHTARQRCVSNAVQTEACPWGCTARPTGTDDTCNAMPAPGSGQVSCAYPQWWNLPFSWSPGYYAIRWGWDNDLRMAAYTPVQLRHASRLEAEGVYAWGWMPEFTDTVTGQRFRFLHLQPSQRLTRAIGTTYPAGTLVGYSGGSTADTGYCVAIPGCGTPNCTTGDCVYSTGAHLCVQTQASYRTAFPTGTDACR